MIQKLDVVTKFADVFIMLTASFRFYHKLTDFSFLGEKDSAITNKFRGNPPFKDVIEALGISPRRRTLARALRTLGFAPNYKK